MNPDLTEQSDAVVCEVKVNEARQACEAVKRAQSVLSQHQPLEARTLSQTPNIIQAWAQQTTNRRTINRGMINIITIIHTHSTPEDYFIRWRAVSKLYFVIVDK